ncbi:phenylalanine--tRNA ligase subunit alpha [Candidatus Methylacidiphilum infernorum]|uniref:Phenylalanine--tRNA ligase alpha subunit n=1 Tax=Candidatus Methylacidiphilum infernorum TaxID=511746 RepID=A0ABX7PUC6_9BACT|nr:phenylalanine--tRNA ligase subunit alpha [Candidatus Methylacidiphilum infernorum]QSR86273.1 phenylalanine--tRNA ligase subunit alpha [Candidatus Methylacidiphilum infernorum]
MQQQLEILEKSFLEEIKAVSKKEEIEAIRIKYFGRKGLVPSLLEKIGQMPREQRPEWGKKLNELKSRLLEALQEREKEVLAESSAFLSSGFASFSFFDPTLPGRPIQSGTLHPISIALKKIFEIFKRIGFTLEEGPEIESEYNNFDALNIPLGHPARNEQDTFYLKEKVVLKDNSPGKLLLRPQTSPVQVRVMKNKKPPIRMIAPGRCYRRDEIDATHSIVFYQLEGLVVDKGISLADLKGTLEYFFRELLGSQLQFRFRPHYFPFTEPSFEVDGAVHSVEGKAVKWLELCGCGMVHPKVFLNVGIDPEIYSGFAFGFGIERYLMVAHKVPDLRLFTENDIRFLKHLSPSF